MNMIFQEALIDEIVKVLPNTREYFGELSSPEKPILSKGDMPVVLVDFTGDRYLSPMQKEIYFNIYIVHITYSKNHKYRSENEKGLLTLIEKIDKQINLKRLAGSDDIRLDRLQKIYDSASESGYLCVYLRNIKTIVGAGC